jgi:hypothetical protein
MRLFYFLLLCSFSASATSSADTVFSKDARFTYEASALSKNKNILQIPLNLNGTNISLSLDVKRPTDFLKELNNDTSTFRRLIILETLELDGKKLSINQNDTVRLRGCFIKNLIIRNGFKGVLIFDETSIKNAHFSGDFFNLQFLDSDLEQVLLVNAQITHFLFARTSLIQAEKFLKKDWAQSIPTGTPYHITFYKCRFGESSNFNFTVLENVRFINSFFKHKTIFKEYIFSPKDFSDKIVGLISNINKGRIRDDNSDNELFKQIVAKYNLKNGYPIALITQLFQQYKKSYENKNLIYSKLTFTNSIFGKGVIFKGRFIDCRLDNTEYNGEVDLHEANFLSSTQGFKQDIFSQSFFKSVQLKVDLAAILAQDTLLDERLSPQGRELHLIDSMARYPLFERLNIKASYFRNLSFDLYWNGYQLKNKVLDVSDWNRIEFFFDKMEEYVEKKGDGDNKKSSLRHLDYQRRQYERAYLWHSKQYFPWFWSFLLQNTVRHGYRGELTFVIVSLLLVLLFAILYYSFFTYPIIKERLHKPGYILASVESLEERRREIHEESQLPWYEKFRFWVKHKNLGRHRIQHFISCYICAFELFFKPQFPSRFLGESDKSLSLVVTLFVNWLIGALMLILALIYIASQYSFVEKFLGL